MGEMMKEGGWIAAVLAVLAVMLQAFNKWSDAREARKRDREVLDARSAAASARADADRAVVDRDLTVLQSKPWRDRVRAALGRAAGRVSK